MITITHWLGSELQITLQAGEEAYIGLRGYVSTCLLSLDFISVGAAAVIQSTLAPKELFDDYATVKTDFPWENIKVAGVTYSEVTFEIPSVAFNAPSVLYVKNTSTGAQAIQIFLRGNRA